LSARGGKCGAMLCRSDQPRHMATMAYLSHQHSAHARALTRICTQAHELGCGQSRARQHSHASLQQQYPADPCAGPRPHPRAPAYPRTEFVPPMGKASYGGRSPTTLPPRPRRCSTSGPSSGTGFSSRPRMRRNLSQPW